MDKTSLISEEDLNLILSVDRRIQFTKMGPYVVAALFKLD